MTYVTADELDLDAILADLRELVEIESPSHDVDALTKSAAALASIIERRVGSAPSIIDGANGPHVHWSGGGDPKVLLLGHHDTVFPLGTLGRRPFDVADGVVRGPGVFDMLGGIVQALHGLDVARRSGADLSGVEMLFSADEEVGSVTSRELIEERAAACGAVLVLEGAAPGGALKTGRKGCGTFEVVVHGRAAHAGLEPEKGANALIEAAHQVVRIAEIGRPQIGTTVTPTVASAGTADNVVPAEARIRVDVRVESSDEAARVEGAMAGLAAVDGQTKLEVLGGVNRPPMPESSSATLFPLAKAIDPEVEGVAVGGGSDGNFTAAIGVATLDGLGAIGGGAHADSEHVVLDTMRPRAALVANLVTAILAR